MIPDFRHNDIGKTLWIEDRLNPSWDKFWLTGLDYGMKVSEESVRGGSYIRSWGSLPSS